MRGPQEAVWLQKLNLAPKEEQYRDQKKNESGTKTRSQKEAHFCPRFRGRIISFITKTGPEMRRHFFAGASLKMETRFAQTRNSARAAYNPISEYVSICFNISIGFNMF